ncbi:NADH:ubiquinone oxidoreductase [Candidatus Magnetomonas plexicatena]|uniref:NADH-quinone oxidoreductase subunit B family protein n=1 Tax=Candidatus Magnetomonas plexicatena TaxID=2552947 RepID=UPI001102D06C|nr:NADH:ubiquinone oxidoreductase [Nitrospirales bacterium LBB_01]
MFSAIKTKLNQGFRSIKDMALPPDNFRGLPKISDGKCANACYRCMDVCPVSAITYNPITIDLSKCILCPECSRVCPEGIIRFTNQTDLASTDLKDLVISSGHREPVIVPDKHIVKLFNKSFKLRSVSAGGCNGCELELNALSSVNFDIGRFGIEFVTSPLHADALVVTGPITRNMTHALEETYRTIPEPKVLILVGTCALSGGIFAGSQAIDRTFLNKINPNLYIAGCPPHPLVVINALMRFLGR